MGTNYYARIIPSKHRKEQLKKAIDSDNFVVIEELYNSMYGEGDEFSIGAEIHLGKRSAGWKFLFNPNYERYYNLTKDGLMKFLTRSDVIIYSEYFGSEGLMEYTEDPDNSNKEYLWTPEQFMNMALNWGNNLDNPGWSGKEYEEWERKEHGLYPQYLSYGDPHENYWREKGYSPEYFNFFNDGMRWSTSCEFS